MLPPDTPSSIQQFHNKDGRIESMWKVYLPTQIVCGKKIKFHFVAVNIAYRIVIESTSNF
jgi:hypothetical protein